MFRRIIGSLALLVATAAALQAQAARLPKVKLTAVRDSFTILANGQPFGASVLTVETTATGARVTEVTSLGPMGSQSSEMLVDAEGRILKLTQTGQMMGQEARIAVDYANGRAKGSASIPGPAGPQTHTVDAEVPADVVDDNMISVLVPLLPWAADASWEFPMFSAGKNAVSTATLRAVASEDVTIPAGTFKAYKVELKAGESTVALWIDAASGRVLKLAPAGAPIELVRAN